mmetsp:Transcript_69474/g.165672  ORF Transcript_69474/g.165672 Transcript_69474/m.165672 type:complete len:304 (-) Transcript_69474:369-1280(-)
MEAGDDGATSGLTLKPEFVPLGHVFVQLVHERRRLARYLRERLLEDDEEGADEAYEEALLLCPSARDVAVEHRCHVHRQTSLQIPLREELSENRVGPLHVDVPLLAGVREVCGVQQDLQHELAVLRVLQVHGGPGVRAFLQARHHAHVEGHVRVQHLGAKHLPILLLIRGVHERQHVHLLLLEEGDGERRVVVLEDRLEAVVLRERVFDDSDERVVDTRVPQIVRRRRQQRYQTLLGGDSIRDASPHQEARRMHHVGGVDGVVVEAVVVEALEAREVQVELRFVDCELFQEAVRFDQCLCQHR